MCQFYCARTPEAVRVAVVEDPGLTSKFFHPLPEPLSGQTNTIIYCQKFIKYLLELRVNPDSSGTVLGLGSPFTVTFLGALPAIAELLDRNGDRVFIIVDPRSLEVC